MAPRSISFILTVFGLVALSYAGPLGPLPNVTSSDVGLKDGNCVVGDVAYMLGDKFVGATPCEQCACTARGVQCAQARCEPRPGCKALHRPDHCCPTYQCECEQEGRVYGNGEKLVDPSDPCRVCYCQGGEVVCRRIACFLRDDCQPRLVKGRCCPEYDNCPLRGVTAIPGLVTSVSSVSVGGENASQSTPPKENIKQEITIKEITPVSEIPVITAVKIKEILPSPSIEVPEYPSSKSPLIPREAIPEKITTSAEVTTKTEEPVVVELISPLPTEHAAKPSEASTETKNTADLLPSKISLSTQDSINSEIYPSVLPAVVASMGVPPLIPNIVPVASTTKVTLIEEEDTSIFDHNPAFPPIPDDLSVIGNHEDEISPDQNLDNEHMTSLHVVESVSSTLLPSEAPIPQETSTTTARIATTTPTSTTTTTTTTTNKAQDVVEPVSTTTNMITEATETSTANVITSTVRKELLKGSPMLNVRTAIPTEILDVPSTGPEDITGELDDLAESVTAYEEPLYIITSTTTEPAVKIETEDSAAPSITANKQNILRSSEVNNIPEETTPQQMTEATEATTKMTEGTSTTFIPKAHITEITSQTEFSSLPIETSDQNPRESSENAPREKSSTTTNAPLSTEIITAKATEPEVTVTQATSTTTEFPFANTEPAVFVTHSESSESTADPVELLNSTPFPTERNAALIDSENGKRPNVLSDLIKLVDDVASISDHTEAPEVTPRPTSSSFSADSEELMPVYKSKNKFNLNSITEIPLKTKNTPPKQKVVEIEDEDFESITDSLPPFDKVEPTTRRPIIDNVSADTMPSNQTEKKDIEIITKSYVPTINRNRPTKVVMKKSVEKPLSEASSEEAKLASSTEASTTSQAPATTPAASTPPAPTAPDALSTTPAQ